MTVQILFLAPSFPYTVAVASADGFIRLWNALNAELLVEWRGSHGKQHGLVQLCCSPDQSHLASADAAGHVQVWDLSVPRLASVLSTPQGTGQVQQVSTQQQMSSVP